MWHHSSSQIPCTSLSKLQYRVLAESFFFFRICRQKKVQIQRLLHISLCLSPWHQWSSRVVGAKHIQQVGSCSHYVVCTSFLIECVQKKVCSCQWRFAIASQVVEKSKVACVGCLTYLPWYIIRTLLFTLIVLVLLWMLRLEHHFAGSTCSCREDELKP